MTQPDAAEARLTIRRTRVRAVEVVDGVSTAPARPGNGLEWDEDQVTRWLAL